MIAAAQARARDAAHDRAGVGEFVGDGAHRPRPRAAGGGGWARVVLVGRDGARAAAAAAELGDAGLAVAADARDFDAVDGALAQAVARWGRLDGAACCVGSILLKPAHRTTDAEWADTLAQNLTSAFNVVRAATPRLGVQGGALVLFSTAAAHIGLPNHEAIAAAKAGVTVGEWGQALREVFGEYRGPTGVSLVIATDGDEDLEAVKGEVERVSKKLGRTLTYVVGKPGLDGHSNGSEQIAARARAAGMNVIYEGIRFTPEEIVQQAIDSQAHVIGLSILSGSHLDLVKETVGILRAKSLDIPVVVGGIIPDVDALALKQMGIRRVYTPKDYKITQIMGDVVKVVEETLTKATE
jgi:(2R)-ethylmalonyl-CoA mutase